MIAKCALIALLAVVATAAPACQQIVLPSSGCSSSGSVLIEASGAVFGGSSSGALARNIVANGQYPVALTNCGPTPDQQIPVTTSSVTAPVQEKPTVRLSSSIPAPRTISHSCTCYKTIVKPRVHQQVITVPSVQRYVETSHKPVVESIQYEAVPVNCRGSGSSSGAQVIEVGSFGSSSSGSVQLISSGSSCGSSFQTVEVPQVQVVEAPRVQAVEVPQVQVVEAPRVQTVEVPRVQVVETPRVQVLEAPRVQVVETPRVQAVEVSSVPVFEAPRVQAVEVPQSFSLGSCSCNY